jgi:hypothetical protein
MKRVEDYRRLLNKIPKEDWEVLLLRESRLPGARANLELVQAVAEEGTETLFMGWLRYDPISAPTNTPEVFLPVCGVVGLGKVLAQGKREALEILRRYAADPRWRVREAVCMALQRWGEVDMPALLEEMASWSRGSPWEQRAAAAALCEPKLLIEEAHARKVLQILDEITLSVSTSAERKNEAFQVLRKGLAYCWSVAAAALPEEGKALLEKWFASRDSDVNWIMRENLKKKRMERMDAEWVKRWRLAFQP